MSRELQYEAIPTAVADTLWAVIKNSLFQVWNGTAFVEQTDGTATAANCCIAMVQIGITPDWYADAPAGLLAIDPNLIGPYTVNYVDAASAALPTAANTVGGQQLGGVPAVDSSGRVTFNNTTIAASNIPATVQVNATTGWGGAALPAFPARFSSLSIDTSGFVTYNNGAPPTAAAIAAAVAAPTTTAIAGAILGGDGSKIVTSSGTVAATVAAGQCADAATLLFYEQQQTAGYPLTVEITVNGTPYLAAMQTSLTGGFPKYAGGIVSLSWNSAGDPAQWWLTWNDELVGKGSNLLGGYTATSNAPSPVSVSAPIAIAPDGSALSPVQAVDADPVPSGMEPAGTAAIAAAALATAANVTAATATITAAITAAALTTSAIAAAVWSYLCTAADTLGVTTIGGWLRATLNAVLGRVQNTPIQVQALVQPGGAISLEQYCSYKAERGNPLAIAVNVPFDLTGADVHLWIAPQSNGTPVMPPKLDISACTVIGPATAATGLSADLPSAGTGALTNLSPAAYAWCFVAYYAADGDQVPITAWSDCTVTPGVTLTS